jgi:hypothetical protein
MAGVSEARANDTAIQDVCADLRAAALRSSRDMERAIWRVPDRTLATRLAAAPRVLGRAL